jgi:hypothetical protein
MSYNPTIFNYLVQQHLANLHSALRSYDSETGRLIDFYKQRPLPEGTSENNSYDGVLIISDGEVIGDALIKKGIVKNQDSIDYKSVSTLDDFFDYFDELENSDGAHFYDNRTHRMGRVQKFNNDFSKILSETDDKESENNDKEYEAHKKRVQSYLPDNFIFSKGATLERNIKNIGLKTDLALNIIQRYDQVDAYQLKQTPYGHLGMGLVTHLGNIPGTGEKGLIETFGFEYAPESDGPFVHDEHPIVAVYTQYGKKDGRVVEIQKHYLPLVDGQICMPEYQKAA